MPDNGKSPGGSTNPQDPQQTATAQHTPDGYPILVADGACLTQAWRQEATTWDGFVAKLDDVADHKECGGYVLGDFGGDGRRLNARCRSRWAVALDYDGAADDLIDRLRATGWRAAWYSSYSHRQPGKGLRFRVIVPLSRPVETVNDHRDAVAGVAEQIGAQGLDPASYSIGHLMFWPSAADAALHEHGSQEGQLADTDDLLVDGALSEHRMTRSSEYDGPDYDGPDYDHLSPERQRQARETVQRALDKWRRVYTDAAEWPEGQEDDEGRGWEGLAKAGAFRLAKLAVHPAFPLTEHEAQAEYEAMVKPIEHGDGCKGKWKYALDKAARQPVEPPEWASAAEEDFEPVEDDSEPPEENIGDWLRVIDLAEVNAKDAILPTICEVDGGQPLFYAGAVNGLHGPPVAGKSFLALMACRSELAAGRAVAYLDLEDTPHSIKRRLTADLGVPDEYLSRFVYLRPSGPLQDKPRAALLKLLAERGVGLVIIDSTGEALAAQGKKPNEDDEVSQWFQYLPEAMARRGHTVVLLDHVPKALDNRAAPIGSQRKLAAISGAQYSVERIKSGFAKGIPGASKVLTTKDRQGNRQADSEAARLVYDGAEFHLRAALAGHEVNPEMAWMVRVAAALGRLPDDHPGWGVNAIKREVSGANEPKMAALRRLVADGYVEVTPHGQGLLHRLVRPYEPEFEAEDE